MSPAALAALGVIAAGSLRALLAAGLLAALALVGYGLLPARRRTQYAELTPLRGTSKAVIAFPLAISVGALATGWLGWVAGTAFGTWSVGVVWIALLALGVRRFAEFRRDALRLGRRLAALARATPLLSATFAVAVLLLLPSLFLPLVDSDGLRYQVAHPKLYLLTGEISTYPWDVTGFFPQVGTMLFLVATALGGGEACKFVHAGFALLSAASLALLVHRGRRSRGAAVAAAFFAFAAPVSVATATAAFVDHAALFHVLVGALLVAASAPTPLVGLALGAAFGTKMTTAPFVLGLAIAAVAARPARARLREALLLAAVLAATFLPFGLRSAVLTGDPFFPLGYGLLGRAIPGVTQEGLAWATSYREEARGLLAVGFLPFQPGLSWDDVAGPQALLGLLAVAVVLRERRLRFLLLPVLVSVAVASYWHPPARYFLPLFAALAAFLALALGRLGRRAAPAATLLVVGVSAAGWVPQVLFGFGASRYVSGRADAETVRAEAIPGFRAARFVNALQGGCVMALDFPAPYYLDRPWVAEGVLNEPPLRLWLAEGAEAGELLDRCRALGVTHVLVTPGWGGGTPASLYPLATNRREAEAIVAFRARLRLVATVDGVDVFELPPR